VDWTDVVQRALSLYEALWVPAGPDSRPLWVDDPAVATFAPFDYLENLVGPDLIANHLAVRCAAHSLAEVRWQPCKSWCMGEAALAVVKQQLWTIDRRSGTREAREHVLVVATKGKGADARLQHVAEASPAVIVEVVKSYERHAGSAGGP